MSQKRKKLSKPRRKQVTVQHEPVFSCGQRFKIQGYGESHLLAQVGPGLIKLISTVDGNRMSDTEVKAFSMSVTLSDVIKAAGGCHVEAIY